MTAGHLTVFCLIAFYDTNGALVTDKRDMLRHYLRQVHILWNLAHSNVTDLKMARWQVEFFFGLVCYLAY